MPKIYNMKEGYKTFRDRIYSNLVTYKKDALRGTVENTRAWRILRFCQRNIGMN